MPLHHANTLKRFETVADQGSCDVATWPVTLDQSDFSTSNRDEILALLAPSGNTNRTIWLVVAALAGGFGLGWAGAWYGPATISVLAPIAQVETVSRRMPDTKPGGRIESTRKIALASASRTPPGVGQPSTVSAPKPLAKASSGAQSAASNQASSAVEADVSVTGSLGSAEPLLSGPETRPTTIGGWAVLDVRGGTAVLEGPDGIRMAARGDVVPGIGRIDSIVRWGNRWIVATASGLISTP